jgi:hypothetical protein
METAVPAPITGSWLPGMGMTRLVEISGRSKIPGAQAGARPGISEWPEQTPPGLRFAGSPPSQRTQLHNLVSKNKPLSICRHSSSVRA